MPSVGTPSSKIRGSTCGAPSAYTDAGPPERTSATGFRRRSSSAEAACETSSEYTRASRTRRAISCEYCPPRSTTSTGRSSVAGGTSRFPQTPSTGPLSRTGGCAAGRRATTSAPVIRSVLRDRDVVRVRLAHAGTRDPDEARRLERLDRRGAAVAHRLPQAADELVQHARERPLVGDAALDPLRHEFLHVLHVALEVAILREPARLHRAERAHAAVLLHTLPRLRQDDVAGRLVGAGEHRAEHHRVGAPRDRLGDVARRGDPAVGDHRDAVTRRNG